MSQAQTSRTIKFISKSGTYNAMITSPQGDVFQEYTGTAPGAVTSVRPDFSQTRPVLYFVCTSSRAAENPVTPADVAIFFNNVELTFDENGLSNNPGMEGVFKKIVPGVGQIYYGVQILSDIAALSGYAGASVRIEAKVNWHTQTDIITASYTIPVQQYTGESYRVTIAPGDTKNFVLTEKGDTCTLRAIVWQGGTEITGALTYKWFQQDPAEPSGWRELPGAAAQTLTVGDDDVSTYGAFRVEVSLSGALIGADVQSVMDASDPLDIDACPDPADEAIYEGDTAATVTYTPQLVQRGSGVAITPQPLFTFVVYDAAGVAMSPLPAVPAASFAVTYAMVEQAQNDVTLIISTASDN
ncbi:MAG: hypothetical protein Q4F07_06820 [Bacteroidales bacterium]|nr:hypothetical protein [Bacteroidales bacterium]